MTGGAWRVELSRRADKDLGRLDPPVQRRVIQALRRLANADEGLDLKRLTASDEQRLRVGDWRVRLRRDAESRTILVLRILPRGRAYDR